MVGGMDELKSESPEGEPANLKRAKSPSPNPNS